MSEEKRMAENYEIISAFRIGDKEVVFGRDERSDKPYFCALYEKEAILCYTRERYEDCYTGSDYISMMELYAERIQTQCQKVRAEWEKVTVPREQITAEMCFPNDYRESIKDKVVAIKPNMLRPEYQTADHQLVYINGGNGAAANARGSACFGFNLYTGQQVRWERYEVMGVVKPECMPDWAMERYTNIQRELDEQKRKSKAKEAR